MCRQKEETKTKIDKVIKTLEENTEMMKTLVSSLSNNELNEIKNTNISKINVGDDDLIVCRIESFLSDCELDRLRDEIGKYFPQHCKDKKIMILDGGLKFDIVKFEKEVIINNDVEFGDKWKTFEPGKTEE